MEIRSGQEPGACHFRQRLQPLTKLTLPRLDGIFGAELTGSCCENGKIFDPRAARGRKLMTAQPETCSQRSGSSRLPAYPTPPAPPGPWVPHADCWCRLYTQETGVWRGE